jgi:mannose/cellobiose epimerase-like protein (N-acyl-D-glucosamine 2-epimerase family)
LMRARARLGRCASPPAFYVGVVDAALARGEDPKLGGLYYSGVAGAPADQKERQDWVQAEALITLLELYRLRRSKARLAAFLRELDWVGRYQVDWRYGTWYGQIDPQLRPKGAKAGGDYRAPYHVGRALLDCLHLADEILDGASVQACTVL